MAHQEACQLYIEQEIKEGLAQGKKPYSIGKELSSWVEKLFKTSIPARTLEQKARRIGNATNVASTPTPQNPSKNQDNQVVEAKIIQKSHGGVRKGAGPPQKYDEPKEAPKPMTMPVTEQDKRQEVLLQAWTELRAWRTKYNEYHELAAIFKVIDKNYSSKLKPGQTLPGAEGSHLPGELNEPSASPIGCEPPGDDQKFPNINDNAHSHGPAPDRTTEPDSPPSEIGEPEPDHMATADPVEPGNGVHDVKECPKCKNFVNTPIKPDGLGTCKVYPKFSWKGHPTLCPSFDAMDSIEVLAARDEAIVQVVGVPVEG
jgi:hypothetical protein